MRTRLFERKVGKGYRGRMDIIKERTVDATKN